MKKTTLTGLLSLSVLALLSGCGEDLPFGGGNGTGMLAPVVTLDTEVAASSRAAGGDGGSRAGEAITASDLSITVASADDDGASFSQTWSTLADFPLDQKFKVGNYNVTAFYGDPSAEGFDLPAYQGTQRVTVAENQASPVSIEARLVNSMISIEYTDAFRNYMSDWSASVAAGDASNPVAFTSAETRPAYVKPGTVKVYVSFTKPNGVSASLEVASIQALACTHYHVSVDVNGGGAGAESLEVTFDASVTEEVTVGIPLDDDLLNAPAPVLTADGFTPGEAVTVAEGMPTAAPLNMSIVALGGISSVTMTTASTSTLAKNWPASIDLVAATAEQRQALAEAGLDVPGLWKNPGEMAVIDFSKVVSGIAYKEGADNTTTFTVTVTDKMRKVCEPMALTVVVNPVTLSISEGDGAYSPGADYTLLLNYNGADVENNVRIEYQNERGTWTRPEVRSITPSASGPTLYEVTIVTPEISRDLVLRAVCGSSVSSALTVRKAPFSVAVSDVDVFANRATLTVTGEEEEGAAIAGKATLYVAEGDGAYAARAFTDNGDGTITLTGLTPATAYRARLEVGDRHCAPAAFTTEAALGVPNGDFEDLVETVKVENMASGGEYTRVTWFGGNMQNHASFTVSEPRGWTSTNSLTCDLGSANQNTWFVTPSVFNSNLYWLNTVDTQGGMGGQTGTPADYSGHAAASGDVAMIIRNVAWDPAGTAPELDKKTATPEHYYCRNTPTLSRTTAGRLSLDADFASRPVSMAGKYKYVRDSQDGSERATVSVELLSGTTVIATGSLSLDAAGDYADFTCPLNYSRTDLKATALRVALCSSDRAEADIKTTKYAELHRQEANGAVFTVDNLTFNY